MIAVVDDDEAVREALRELLHVHSITCRTFDRAEAFLAASTLGEFDCDCVISDLRMPGMGGLELQRKLGALGSPIPVIIVTSVSDPLIRSRTMDEGAFACLTKPIRADDLLQHLTAALALGKRSGETSDDK